MKKLNYFLVLALALPLWAEAKSDSKTKKAASASQKVSADRSTAAATANNTSLGASPEQIARLNEIQRRSRIVSGRYEAVGPNQVGCFSGPASFRIVEGDFIFELGPRIQFPGLQVQGPVTTQSEADAQENTPACHDVVEATVGEGSLRIVSSGDCWGEGWAKTMEIRAVGNELRYSAQLRTGIQSGSPQEQRLSCTFRRVSR